MAGTIIEQNAKKEDKNKFTLSLLKPCYFS